MNLLRPNFLIVGAAKSGTTSLHRYLVKHDQVFLPAKKEPLYFISGIVKDQTVDSWMKAVLERYPNGKAFISSYEEYLKLFQPAVGCKAIGEASATYLYYYRHAIPRIKEKLGDPKIIIILRDPMKKALSQYRYLLRAGHENLGLPEALEKEQERQAQYYCALYHYVGQGLYYQQVKAYLDHFSQVKVILLKDLKSDPQHTISSLFQFLEVEDLEIDQFKQFNKTAFAPRNHYIYQVHKKLNSPAGQFIRKRILEPIAPAITEKIKSFYLHRNDAKNTFDSESKARLIEAFREDTHKLEGLIGKSLSSWSTY